MSKEQGTWRKSTNLDRSVSVSGGQAVYFVCTDLESAAAAQDALNALEAEVKALGARNEQLVTDGQHWLTIGRENDELVAEVEALRERLAAKAWAADFVQEAQTLRVRLEGTETARLALKDIREQLEKELRAAEAQLTASEAREQARIDERDKQWRRAELFRRALCHWCELGWPIEEGWHQRGDDYPRPCKALKLEDEAALLTQPQPEPKVQQGEVKG